MLSRKFTLGNRSETGMGSSNGTIKMDHIYREQSEPILLDATEFKKRLGPLFRVVNFLGHKAIGQPFLNTKAVHLYDPKTGIYSPVDVVTECEQITAEAVSLEKED